MIYYYAGLVVSIIIMFIVGLCTSQKDDVVLGYVCLFFSFGAFWVSFGVLSEAIAAIDFYLGYYLLYAGSLLLGWAIGVFALYFMKKKSEEKKQQQL